jgi:hypothetical protein
MMRPLLLLLSVLLLCPTSFSGAQTPDSKPAAPPSCPSPEYRQFDFWAGTWDVTNPKGDYVGSNRIEKILGGCALLENWTGKGAVRGTSLNMYDAADGKWHQFWVDNSGGRLDLSGEFKDGRMILAGTVPSSDGTGQPVQHRISWEKLDDNRVRQLWESSTDGGKTWSVAFDGMYVRKG